MAIRDAALARPSPDASAPSAAPTTPTTPTTPTPTRSDVAPRPAGLLAGRSFRRQAQALAAELADDMAERSQPGETARANAENDALDAAAAAAAAAAASASSAARGDGPALAAREGDHVGAHALTVARTAGLATSLGAVGGLALGAGLSALAIFATGGMSTPIVAAAWIGSAGMTVSLGAAGAATGLRVDAVRARDAVGGGCSTIARGSPNVFIEGRAVARAGDDENDHGHTTIAEGSATVLVNGRPLGRISDRSSCGGAITTGATRTFIGGPRTTVARVAPAAGMASGIVAAIGNADPEAAAQLLDQVSFATGIFGMIGMTPVAGLRMALLLGSGRQTLARATALGAPTMIAGGVAGHYAGVEGARVGADVGRSIGGETGEIIGGATGGLGAGLVGGGIVGWGAQRATFGGARAALGEAPRAVDVAPVARPAAPAFDESRFVIDAPGFGNDSPTGRVFARRMEESFQESLREPRASFREQLDFFAQRRRDIAIETNERGSEMFGVPRPLGDGGEMLTPMTGARYGEIGRSFTPGRTEQVVGVIDGERVPLTSSTWFAGRPILEHTTPANIEPVLGHAGRLYDRILTAQETPSRLVEMGGELHWWLAHAMPFQRGSAATTDAVVRHALARRGIVTPAAPPGFVPDLVALRTSTPEAFARVYRETFHGSCPSCGGVGATTPSAADLARDAATMFSRSP